MSKFNLDRRQFITAGGLTAATAALTLAGCGGSSDSGKSDAGTSDGGEKKSGYKVAMIMSGIITDGGWDQGHYESLKRACEKHADWEMLEPKENTADADAATAAESYIDQDVDLIVGNGNQFASAWAEDYENTDNVETVLPDFTQLGALAGVVAGLMTQNKSIGFIGGMKLPSTINKYSAYLAAAQKIDPSIKGQYNFEAGFTDASLGTKLAEQWINTNNVDVMWGDASAVDNGVRKALENAGADSHFDIAQPIDIMGDSQPTVVTSTITDWKIDQAMDEIVAGTFGGGKAITANMDNGGVSLGEFSSKIPEDIKSKIEEYAEQVKVGTFVTEDEVNAIKSTL